MDNEDFEIEFQSDEEIEKMMDDIIVTVGEVIAAEEEQPGIIVPHKIQQMQFAHGVLRYITKGTDAVVSYELHKPFKSTGSISVEAKSLQFSNAEWFSRVAEFASNTEVYPLTNGKIRMTFGFNGIVRPL